MVCKCIYVFIAYYIIIIVIILVYYSQFVGQPKKKGDTAQSLSQSYQALFGATPITVSSTTTPATTSIPMNTPSSSQAVIQQPINVLQPPATMASFSQAVIQQPIDVLQPPATMASAGQQSMTPAAKVLWPPVEAATVQQ